MKKYFLIILLAVICFGCGPQIATTFDEFTGDTIHIASASSKDKGLLGDSFIMKATRKVKNNGEELFFLRLIWIGKNWLFINNLTMKNPISDWEKQLSWNHFDVNRTVITGNLLTEEIVVITSRDEFIDIISQTAINLRLYGNDYYSDFSYSSEKLKYWKTFLETKMQ